MTNLALAASVSGVACGLLPVIQIVRIVRGRTSAGVSLGYVGGNLANASIFGWYGITTGNVLIAVTNLLWLATGGAMFVTAAAYRRRAAVPAPAALAVPPALAALDGIDEKQWAEADTLVLRPRPAAA